MNGGSGQDSVTFFGAQERDRKKTFGTGTVLQTFSLSNSSALMLAIEEWLTPAGHVIWHQGISPDVVVPLPPDVTPLIPTNEKEKALPSSQREAFEML
jgi:carboxyl-terminal processing protease